MRRLACIFAIMAGAVAACSPPHPEAKARQDYTAPTKWVASSAAPFPLRVSYHDLMSGIIGASAFPIFQLSQREQPLVTSDWTRVGAAATNLIAMSSLLSMEGMSPEDRRRFNDPDWLAMVTGLREASLQVAAAADQQDRSQLVSAAAAVGKSCQTCHEQFQKAPPSRNADLASNTRTGATP